MDWISVKNRLPEKGASVPCYFQYGDISVIAGNIYHGGGIWMQDGDNVTHWMPAPEPPTEIEGSKRLITTKKGPEKNARVRELVEADREGRIKIYPKAENNTCGACRHFHRIAGRRCGTCDVQSQYRDRYGREDDRRGTFTPSQSRKACKRFEHREE